MTTYEQTIVAIVEKGNHKKDLANIDNNLVKNELTFVWEQIENVCK